MPPRPDRPGYLVAAGREVTIDDRAPIGRRTVPGVSSECDPDGGMHRADRAGALAGCGGGTFYWRRLGRHRGRRARGSSPSKGSGVRPRAVQTARRLWGRGWCRCGHRPPPGRHPGGGRLGADETERAAIRWPDRCVRGGRPGRSPRVGWGRRVRQLWWRCGPMVYRTMVIRATRRRHLETELGSTDGEGDAAARCLGRGAACGGVGAADDSGRCGTARGLRVGEDVVDAGTFELGSPRERRRAPLAMRTARVSRPVRSASSTRGCAPAVSMAIT